MRIKGLQADIVDVGVVRSFLPVNCAKHIEECCALLIFMVYD